MARPRLHLVVVVVLHLSKGQPPPPPPHSLVSVAQSQQACILLAGRPPDDTKRQKERERKTRREKKRHAHHSAPLRWSLVAQPRIPISLLPLESRRKKRLAPHGDDDDDDDGIVRAIWGAEKPCGSTLPASVRTAPTYNTHHMHTPRNGWRTRARTYAQKTHSYVVVGEQKEERERARERKRKKICGRQDAENEQPFTYSLRRLGLSVGGVGGGAFFCLPSRTRLFSQRLSFSLYSHACLPAIWGVCGVQSCFFGACVCTCLYECVPLRVMVVVACYSIPAFAIMHANKRPTQRSSQGRCLLTGKV